MLFAPSKKSMIETIIFDLGGVLIDWNPKYLYRQIFSTEQEVETFLDKVCTSDWNEEQDAGRTLKEATDTLIKMHPEHEENITAYYGRWEEMLGGVIEGTVNIFKRLKTSEQYKILALTNWSYETFPIAQKRYEVLSWFDGVVVSGTEKLRKPFPEFYQILVDRYNVVPANALFIDDNLRNVHAAQKMGFNAVQFTTANDLEQQLKQYGINV